ncbi:hypothetical protein [Kaistella palustris]|uniref:hypothetical protein n=1 Tax=Kaistella palustris TaxID=493376 RepID=UPI0004191EA0|nr:hypothetical protein [Kaistella palustris]
MERNKKRELQVKIFRFFVRESWRKPLKSFVYRERSKLRYQKLILLYDRKRTRTKDLIVTLTSFPGRIYTISDTLVSLLNQSLRPEKIVLWLAEEQFPEKENELPTRILKLRELGLEIRWCKDLKSYKKLLPALDLFNDKLLVTADDDIYYPKNWLRDLYDSYLSDPESIFCHRVHRITFNNTNEILPYQQWDKCLIKGQEKENDVLFFTTGGGVLFPPNCFYQDVAREDLFLELCPLADDIWFWSMILLNKKKIRIAKNNVYRIKNNGNTQEDEPLWKTNREAGLNDEQLRNVRSYYGERFPF